MAIERDEVITVEILVEPQLAQLQSNPPHASGVIAIEQATTRGQRTRWEQPIRLYPIMQVELISTAFDIKIGDEDPYRSIDMSRASEAWTWSVTPVRAGEHKITVNVFGKLVDDVDARPTLESSITRLVTVLDKPLYIKLRDTLLNNWIILLIALIGTNGPLGLRIAALNHRLHRQEQLRKQDDEAWKKRVEDLEQKVSVLSPPPKSSRSRRKPSAVKEPVVAHKDGA